MRTVRRWLENGMRKCEVIIARALSLDRMEWDRERGEVVYRTARGHGENRDAVAQGGSLPASPTERGHPDFERLVLRQAQD